MSRLPFVVGAFGVCVAVVGAARQGAPRPRPQQPVFRAGTDYVELDVVVTDQHDRAVAGLTRADFAITEHGEPQAIDRIEYLSIPPTHRTVADVRTTAPAVDVASNAHPPNGRQWVLVIDDLHIIETHIAQTKKVVQEFLESLPPEDSVAVTFIGRADLSQDFTSDLGAQLRAVNRIKGALGFAPDAANQFGTGGSDMNDTGANATQRYMYARDTVFGLKNICAALVHSSYPRKALVYVSEGLAYDLGDSFFSGYLDFSADPTYAQDVLQDLQETFDSAREDGVPVYTIDPRGVPDCTSVRGDCAAPPWVNIHKQQQMMRTLAENTGGLALVNQPDLTKAVHEIVEDNDSYYLLGYYPRPAVHDGKFHDVKVSLVGHPGYHVRAKAGYTAQPAIVTKETVTQSLNDVLGAALPGGALELRAFAAPLEPAASKGMQTVVTVEVTYPVSAAAAGHLEDTLQVGIVAVDHDGKTRASLRRAFHFTASPRNERAVTYQVTYLIDDALDVPSGPVVLRVGVASEALGEAGAIHLPLDVPGTGDDALHWSGLVLGLAGATREAAVRRSTISALVPFQPTTTRTFTPADTLRVFGHAFWKSDDTAVEVTVAIVGGPGAAPRALRLAGTRDRSGREQATLDTTVPLADLRPGAYTLEVTAHLGSSRTPPARREVAFTIR
jgi:VWFA-related protein